MIPRARILASFLLFLSLFLLVQSQDSSDVVITYISNSPADGQGDHTTSVAGGSTFYVKGTGFDMYASNNYVYVGAYQANVLGVNDVFLIFEAPAMGQEIDLKLSIYVVNSQTNQKKAATCNTDCTIYYRWWVTTELWQVKPRSAGPTESVYIYGIDRFASTSLIESIKSGPFICDRVGLDDDDISYGSANFLSCKIALEMVAGEYSADLKVIQRGYAAKSPTYQGLDLQGNLYDFRCIPLITDVSNNIGSPQGQILTLTGFGFSGNISSVQVIAGDYPCTVLSSNNYNVVCKVGTTALSQSLYLQGSGIERFLYSGTGNAFTISNGIFANLFWANNVSYPLQNYQIRNSFDWTPQDGVNGGEVNVVEAWKGFFKAPYTGNYKFYLAADDNAELWLSNTTNSTNTSYLNKIAYYYAFTAYGRYDTNNSLRSAYIPLQQNQYYLINAFRNQGSGDSHMWVGVEVPYTAPTPLRTPSTQIINITYTPVRETQFLTVNNYQAMNQFKIVVSAKDPSSGKQIFYAETNPMNYNVSASDLQSRVSNDIGWSWPIVTRSGIDSLGNILTSTATPTGYLYNITFTYYRNQFNADGTQIQPTIKLMNGNDFAVSISLKQKVAPSPTISGNITLSFNGTQFSVPGNSTDIDSYFSFISGLDRNFNSDIRGTNYESHYYIVKFTGLSNTPLMTVAANGLQGGPAGTPPTVNVYELIPSSNNLFYDPIPNEFLFTFSSVPHITVSSDGIMSKCVASDCTYTINTQITPQLDSFTQTNTGLSLTISNYQNVTIYVNSTTVDFAGSSCSVNYVLNASITCLLPKNPSGSFQIEAGSYRPNVQFQGIGYSTYGATLNNVTVPLVFTALNTTTGGSSLGGQALSITGSGFPINNLLYTSVTICGAQASIISFSNTVLVINTPAKPSAATSPCDLNITVNGVTIKATTYTYSDALTPTITSLTPLTSSPSQKAVITVVGTSFGSNSNAVTVLLVNSTNSSIFYQLSVLTINATTITAVLGGGKIGQYNLKVLIQGVGYSKEGTTGSSLFSYTLAVTGISPSSGSIYGGTLITITGKNFSPINNQNQVFIGDVINNLCDIVSSSFTQIVCQTRVAPAEAQVGAQTVYVYQRVQDLAVCSISGGCSFTFDSTISPQVTSSSITARAGDSVVLNGTKLAPQSGGVVSITFYNGTTAAGETFSLNTTVNATLTTSTQVTFTMPALREATYLFTVYVGNQGWAQVNMAITTPIEAYGVSFTDSTLNASKLGSAGGVIMSISGNGFYNESIEFETPVSFGYVYSITPTLITFATGQVASSNTPTTFQVNVYRSSTAKFGCSSCNFMTNASSTITLTAHNCTPTVGSSFYLSANGTLLNNTNKPIVATLDLLDYKNRLLVKSYTGTVVNFTGTNITVSFNNVPMGTYALRLLYSEHGFAYISSTTYRTVTVFPSSLTSTAITSSIFGGKSLVISGTGLPPSWVQTNLFNITVCGSLCPVLSSSSSSVTCQIPDLLTMPIITNYNLVNQYSTQQTSFAVTSDNAASQNNINDNKLNTFYDSASATCFVTFDFGSSFVLNVSQIQYYPTLTKSIKTFQGMLFQGSTDNSIFKDLFSTDVNMKTGWNTWTANNSVPLYRYFRMTPNATQTATRCNIAEVRFYGSLLYSGSSTTTSTICPVNAQMNGTQVSLTSTVEYRADTTPVVQSISPALGPTSGGTNITITGTGFGTTLANVVVTIDQVTCVITAVTASSITCTTGARPTFVPSSFVVSVLNNLAALSTDPFVYIDRWSDAATWGGESPPRDGDSVYIPAGQNVLLDQSTPILNSVIIEGTLIFQDMDMTFDAYYLICMQGRVQIGTLQKPFLSKLVITMHGRKWFPKQLPEFGNKVWAFHMGVLDMHGKPRQFTWTVLTKTAEVNDLTVTVKDAVDWTVNDRIAIASTDFNHNHSEWRTIVAVSSDNKTLTLDSALEFRHYGQIETYGNFKVPMQAEVALLSRNVLFQGSTDDVSDLDRYGAHIMLHLPGAVGRFSYVEFTNVGQGFIIGRYPMHFHRIDDASDSYAIGNAVHHSWARVVAIHDTHFMTVQKNVGYRIYGHSFFIEDGIETNNLLEDNLAISTIQIWTLINTDVTAASYWITNPNNIVRRNRAAGGDWFGFWYKLENRVTGPSSNPDICPDGVEMGEFSNNLAHSYFQGLRIAEYVPRTYPCIPDDDPSVFQTDLWYANNPAIPAVFSDFIAYKNFEYGLFVDNIGSVEFRNFIICESRISGIFIGQTNFTNEDQAKVNGALIVGLSINNTDDDVSRYQESYGMVTPRTDFLLVNNVSFYNFSLKYNMSAFQSCAYCWHIKRKITGGKTTKFAKLSFTNVEQKIVWQVNKREIFDDSDGTFTELGKKGMITKYYPHLDSVPECVRLNQTMYDDSVFCDSRVQLRSVMFRNPIPNEMYRALEIRVLRIPDVNYNMSLANDTNFTRMVMLKIKIDTPYTWDMPFVTGYIYNIHWQNGNLDWTHMNFYPTQVWKATDKGVIFRFNYTDTKEDYLVQVHKWGGTVLNGTHYNETANSAFPMDPITDNFSFGDYILRNVSQLLYLGINGKQNGTLDVDTVKCRLYCPTINDTNVTQETFIRLWSNATQWPNQTLPAANSIVQIPKEWRIKLDIDPPNLDTLVIDGELQFDPSRPISVLTASIIWARLGNITAGNASVPYPNQIVINMTGNRSSHQLLIDANIDSGSNILAVTGALSLYAVTRNQTWSKLGASAMVGDTVIQLIDYVNWTIGDSIVIAPTEMNPQAYETRKIVGGSGNTFTLDQPLVNFHYGSNTTDFTADFGTTLDMRAGVGLLSRNIKITTDPSNNWGANVLIYQFVDNNQITRRGHVELQGVEIAFGGQPDTERASLDIKYVQDPGPMSFVHNCSIHDGIGWGIHVLSSKNVSIEDNLFFNCEKFLVRAISSNNYTIINNLLIAPRKRNLTDTGLYDMVAGIDIFKDQWAKNTGSSFSITRNLVQGGDGNGYVIPGMECGEQNIGFHNNSAQSQTYAGLLIFKNNSYCFELTDFSASKCAAGVLSNFNGIGLSIQRMVLAENTYNSKLWMGHEADDITLTFTNIVFMAMARPQCASCYSDGSSCNDMKALLVPIVQIHGKDIPIDKHTPLDILSQCTDSSFDQKLIMTNIQFYNYKIDYTQDANANYKKCSNNYIFQQPSVPDQSARVYLFNTIAKNSVKDSYVQLEEPPQNFLFWRGGCGDFNCSGNKNWILTDTDGKLFGQPSQVIPHNDSLVYSNCVDNHVWNAKLCTGIGFGMMEFQNDGPDQRLRLIAPINVTTPHALFVLNQWREWQWNGPDPMDKRLARFNVIIELNQSVNLSPEPTMPEEWKFKLENYGNFWWTIVNMRYERPNVIEVWNMFNNTFIKPYRMDQNINLTALALNPNSCGANIYDPDTSNITFVLNNRPNCVLKVRTIDAIRITMHLDTTVADFYANNGVATFIDKISAFLGLDMSRIRIASIKTGSVYVGFSIVANKALSGSTSALDTETGNYTNATNASQIAQFNSMVNELTNYSNVLQQAVNNGTLNISNIKILDMQSQLIVTNITNSSWTNTSNNTSNNTTPKVIVQGSEDNTTMIVLLAVLIPGCSLLLLLLCFCIKNKGGVSMIKLAFDYSFNKKEVEVTFNQELINQSRGEAEKERWKDAEAPFESSSRKNVIYDEKITASAHPN